jgi:UDP-2,3-diacylglucosamine pyrophosphatase LpxH
MMRGSRLCVLALMLGISGWTCRSTAEDSHASLKPRSIYIISDLHFGVGKDTGAHWDPHEDFRWPRALEGFLNEINNREPSGADLVIAGDLLELWQPPASISCRNGGNRGCSVDEVTRLTAYVTNQHKAELASLGAFASRGENHVFVVPGNHDAATLLPGVWEIVNRVAGGRLEFVPQGIWVSQDGQVVVEHGHQIGADVNGFPKWPEVTLNDHGVTYLRSPWGERFVQRIFNDEEASYPIIDNLIPESAGARIRLADRGLWKSAADLARFIEFNALQTSWSQKGQALGGPTDSGTPAACDPKALGYKLVLYSLPAEDAFRVSAEGDTPEARALRHEMNSRVSRLSDDEVAQLCAAARSSGNLNGLVQGASSSHESVMRTHLSSRLRTYPKMRTFVYAHTHQIEMPSTITISMTRSASVANDGAFQRLISEEGYRKRTKTLNLSIGEGLAKIPLESLAPCYGFVFLASADQARTPHSQQWLMDEKDTVGKILEVGDPACE